MLKPMIAAKKGYVPATLGKTTKTIHYWTPEQLQQIIENAPHYQSKIAFAVMGCTGARVSELLMLTPSSFKFFRGRYYVHIPTLKQREDEPPLRTVPIPPGLYALVQQYASAYGIRENSPLFPVNRRTIWKWVKKAAKQAGLPTDKRARPHAFRHTFAMICVLDGARFWSLNAWLGHSDPLNTYKYVHLAAEDTAWDYPQDTFAQVVSSEND